MTTTETDTPRPGDDTTDTDTAAALQFASFDVWFDRWLAGIIARKLTTAAGRNRVFCPRWWEHPEVVVRLHTLWTAWESATAAKDGAAMSGWWVHHADPQLRTMLDAEHGPMYLCTRGDHQPTPVLRSTLTPPPAGWFDDLNA